MFRPRTQQSKRLAFITTAVRGASSVAVAPASNGGATLTVYGPRDRRRSRLSLTSEELEALKSVLPSGAAVTPIAGRPDKPGAPHELDMAAPTTPPAVSVSYGPTTIREGGPTSVLEAFIDAMEPREEDVKEVLSSMPHAASSHALGAISSRTLAALMIRSWGPAVAFGHVVKRWVVRDRNHMVERIRWAGATGTWRLRPMGVDADSVRARRALILKLLGAATGREDISLDAVCKNSSECVVDVAPATGPATLGPAPSALPWREWLESGGSATGDNVLLTLGGHSFHVPAALWTTCKAIWDEEHDTIDAQPSAGEQAKSVDVFVGEQLLSDDDTRRARELLLALLANDGRYEEHKAPEPPALAEVLAALRGTPQARWLDLLTGAYTSFYADRFPTLESLMLGLIAVALRRDAEVQL